MTKELPFRIDTKWILSKRGPKNHVSASKAYACLVEDEYSINGKIEPVATIFLTNRECPFRCLMCDLWKNTTDQSVVPGEIPQQHHQALAELPPAKHIKLYNSGNFFDHKAIPKEDYQEIARLCDSFETVLVEAHPKFIGPRVLEFQSMLKGSLQVAIGLETVHPSVIKYLNKRMSLKEFSDAVKYLKRNNIESRAFILLRPPFLSETEGIEWAIKSAEFAYDSGVECVTIIPTRGGNGALDELAENGQFSTPTIRSLEMVQDHCLSLKRGRAFADLWDIEHFYNCNNCNSTRVANINRMNRYQKSLGQTTCPVCFS